MSEQVASPVNDLQLLGCIRTKRTENARNCRQSLPQHPLATESIADPIDQAAAFEHELGVAGRDNSRGVPSVTFALRRVVAQWPPSKYYSESGGNHAGRF